MPFPNCFGTRSYLKFESINSFLGPSSTFEIGRGLEVGALWILYFTDRVFELIEMHVNLSMYVGLPIQTSNH